MRNAGRSARLFSLTLVALSVGGGLAWGGGAFATPESHPSVTRVPAMVSSPRVVDVTSVAPVEPGAAATAPDTKAFFANVQTFYAAWTTNVERGGTAGGRLATAHLSPDLAREVTDPKWKSLQYATDPVLCGQNTPMQRTFGEPTAKGDDVSMVVHDRYAYGINDIVVSGSASSGTITGITCDH